VTRRHFVFEQYVYQVHNITCFGLFYIFSVMYAFIGSNLKTKVAKFNF